MIIELLNGTRYDTSEYQLKRLFHYIPSANIVHNNSELLGRSDYITNSRLNNRVIRVEFLYITQDIYDYYILRERLNDLFMREEEFYIIFKREPHKRWLVKINSQFEINPNPKMDSFTIEFITQKFYSESVGTSLDLQNRKEWDVDLWSWDGTIDWDKNYSYTFNSNNFNVENLGNIKIEPGYYDLQINIQGEATDFLELTNTTNGDVFRYNGNLTNTDTLTLRGIRTFKNNVSVFRDTNRKLISLDVGNNDFVVTGGTINNIEFNFRFLYK